MIRRVQLARNGRVALMNRQSPQRHAAARAAASDAADALREAQSGLSDRFEAVEQKAKESIYAPSDDGMTSGDEDLPEIEEIFVDNYDDKIEKAPDSIVLVDFYTKWCGPCKLMYPKLCEMQQEYKGKITFYKVNCTKSFKERGKELGIKVAPTFIFYKDNKQERMITGAKLDAIREALAELAP